MQLLIHEKLKQYRLKLGFTQEEIAVHLGVSCQAVSKWERNEGYPDITMLPALANYFGITVDELIGMEELAAKTQYNTINHTWEETHKKAKETQDDALHRQNIALMRNALKRYPNDALLLVQLSTSLERLGGTPEEKAANLKESILLQEQILRGEDSQVRSATLYNICFSYEKSGAHEKALAAAAKLPNLFKARENALVSLTDGAEKREIARSSLAPISYILTHHLSAMAEPGQEHVYKEKLRQIQAILFDDLSPDEAKQLWLSRQKIG